VALAVAQPTLAQPDAGTVLSAAQPIALHCGPVLAPDGTELTQERLVIGADGMPQRAGYRLLRISGTSGAVWDPAARTWAPPDADPPLEPLWYRDGVWQSVLVAAGAKDEATGLDKLATDPATGIPVYAVVCAFLGRDGQDTVHEGASPTSAPVQVLPAGSRDRGGVTFDPEDPTQTTRLRLYVKDSGLTERAFVELRAESGGYVAELNAGGASARIEADGSIVVAPAPNQGVTVQSDLLVNGVVIANGYF
jgi:hypothetical protein